MSMADLLAKQDEQSSSTKKKFSVVRGQEVEGEVIAILPQEIVLDLGTKAEGILPKRDLSEDQLSKLKVGDKFTATVVYPENESGQVVLTFQRPSQRGGAPSSAKFSRFEQAKEDGKVLTGKGLEVNKGGLIIEVLGVRGFLPSSQVALAQASNIDDLVGKEIQVTVIDIDPSQNRLIFSQKSEISEEVKEKIDTLKIGDKVEGEVAAVLPFGIFVSLQDQLEGLVHVSEISWEKVEDPNTLYKVGDKVSAKVISVDSATGKVNLSIKQLGKDPFSQKVEGIEASDVVKGEVIKVSANGISVMLEGGAEGLVSNSKIDETTKYEVGDKGSFLVSSIDTQKRRVNLTPFVTSTKGLIYK